MDGSPYRIMFRNVSKGLPETKVNLANLQNLFTDIAANCK
ncbi:hypothetical protein Z949_785 [Sulfitobacter guttiformis KCTC 32187]|nr:hypothetical protein Z949_785 [Sulfitobacter guttiformis KCTC 32187]